MQKKFKLKYTKNELPGRVAHFSYPSEPRQFQKKCRKQEEKSGDNQK